MNVVQNHWQPRVVHIRFPLTRQTTRQILDSKAFAKSFPILAVTRTKTVPCLTVSNKAKQRAVSSRQNHVSFQDSEKQGRTAPRNSSSVPSNLLNGVNRDEKYSTENSDGRKSTSLPVWPVTNPSTIANMTSDSQRELPKPKLNLDWTWEPKRKTSGSNGSSRQSASGKIQNPNESIQSERTKMLLRVKPPPRSCTPMSEYDPDRLNIGQVVKFLDTHNEDNSNMRSVSRETIAVSRPRPFTVAQTERKYGNRAVKSATGLYQSVRRSPFGARRYRKSSKSQESNNRDLAVSPLSMSEKRASSRRETKHRVMKMNTLANIAARYTPDTNDTETKSTDTSTKNDQAGKILLPATKNGCVSPEQYIGNLKYKSATFHSFPTNIVETKVDKKESSKVEEDACQPLDKSTDLKTDRSESIPDRKPTVKFAEDTDCAFNASNAIRLPSVFDNVDLESEKGWMSNCDVAIATKQLQTMTVSEFNKVPDQEPEVLSPNCGTCWAGSRDKSRHSRHLSLVFSRERSVERCTKRSSSVDRQHRHRRTANWVTSCAEEQSAVIELKLSHGSPRL